MTIEPIDDYLNRLEAAKGPNAITDTGEPIIVFRAKRRQAADVLRLLKKGADPNVVDEEDETLLNLAVEYEMVEVCKRLLALGVDPNYSCRCETPTALFRAARHGNHAITRLLIEHGASVDATSYADETPLMSACESGHLEVSKVLIDAGAGINKCSKSGRTPLIHAGMGGHASIAAMLINHGADPDFRDCHGCNATDWARKNHDAMVAQGFRVLGIPDKYSIGRLAEIEVEPVSTYDVFVSYRHLHYLSDSEHIRASFYQLGKSVFVDRHELKLDPDRPLSEETIKSKLRRALLNSSLTIFLEIYWDGSHGEERYSDDRFDWQCFELINSKRAVLLSPSRRICEPLVMVPGEKLGVRDGFLYDSYLSLCMQLLRVYL